MKQFTAALLCPWKDAVKEALMTTFETLVTAAIFVGWLSTVLLFALALE